MLIRGGIVATFEDTVGERVSGTRRLVPAGAVRAGRWVSPKVPLR